MPELLAHDRRSPVPRRLVAAAFLCSVVASSIPAQSRADTMAIRTTALDYVEGWYEGDSVRMARAVHPMLVKRIVATDSTGQPVLGEMNAAELVAATAAGYGRHTPPDRRQAEVAILDIFNDVATVRTTMSDWIDYMQLARWNGNWRIVNVLWALKPGAD